MTKQHKSYLHQLLEQFSVYGFTEFAGLKSYLARRNSEFVLAK